ncbi:MAG TPA: ThuA domain-containing protein [Candidatus Limnocylindria bacterium]|nr:ThuA domain-containing protein [Candidatus Limnocylindria bacterium]
MKRLFLACFLAATSLFAADLSSFNGTWIIQSLEANGSPQTGDAIDSIVMTLKDGTYEYNSNDANAKGRFTVDFSKTPATMDVTETEGGNVGRTITAIVELIPGGWRANYAFGNGDRPTEFKTSQDSGHVLASYKRKPGTEPAVKPLRVLLLAGGCCHDYEHQKDILKAGLEARANVTVDFVFTPDGSTKPPLTIYGHPDYATGYDLVLHDECAADVNEEAVIAGVLKPHLDGIPGVNLHCAMHCYRIGNPNDPARPGTPHSLWFDYLGLQSSGHGAQKPIAITFLDPDSPITQGMANWTTINEELYNNIQVWGNTKPLARGKQDAGDRPGQNDTTVVWTHEYGPKHTRVFSTTLGHNNATVSDPRYLDLVTRGVLWATGHLGADGKPASGYGPGGK